MPAALEGADALVAARDRLVLRAEVFAEQRHMAWRGERPPGAARDGPAAVRPAKRKDTLLGARAAQPLKGHAVRALGAPRHKRVAHDAVLADREARAIDKEAKPRGRPDAEFHQVGARRIGGQDEHFLGRRLLGVAPLPVALLARLAATGRKRRERERQRRSAHSAARTSAGSSTL